MDAKPGSVNRRGFLRTVGLAAGASLWGGRFLGGPQFAWAADEDALLAGRPLVRYPEKTDLILLTSRPPQLETPMKYFETPITPNEAFYVRYHISPPTSVDLATWRLKIGGHVDHPLELSMDDLRSKFTPTTIVAVNQCSGNGRGYFEPRIFGGQWANGAMGNAEWTGVRLRDILSMAAVKQGAVDVSFNGLDRPAMPTDRRLREEPQRDPWHGRSERSGRLPDERQAAAHAQRFPRASHCARLVRHVLGEEPFGHYRAR